MKIKQTLKTGMLAIAALLMFSVTKAQPHKLSPHLTATGTIGGADISITYGSPAVKGRQIWGALEPYDKPWRAGADEATTLETTKDLKIEGKKLPAGKYTVFVTPVENDEWVVTINSETGQWGIKRDGSANFDPAKNILVLKIKPKKSDDLVERLTYVIDPKGKIEMQWEHIIIPLKVKADEK